MSLCYGPLAARYDALTGDVPYEALASWYVGAFSRADIPVKTVLDLCCGTGTLTLLLAERGYETLAADASAEMLSVFQQKLFDLPESVTRPLLLCQRAEELDLYGTVDAAVCSLDGFNYLPPAALEETLGRLRLFIAPGGLLCFDVLTPARLRALDGQCFVDEGEDYLCLWRAALEGESLRYGMDIFRRRKNGLWERGQEEHTEYLHTPEGLLKLLEGQGFGQAEISSDGPQSGAGRLFITAKRM